jgi:two-component system sensor histidine kinase UhpB
VLNCPDAVNTLAPTISIHIFRIVQEGLTNIIRHAHATEACVTLSLDHQAHWLHLHICDNGVGCVSEQLNSGFGLLGMRERINSLGGDLCIESLSQSHQGMTLIARIPLQ